MQQSKNAEKIVTETLVLKFPEGKVIKVVDVLCEMIKTLVKFPKSSKYRG